MWGTKRVEVPGGAAQACQTLLSPGKAGCVAFVLYKEKLKAP